MLTVHVVSHTHWDREWYHPAERFRQRLVALIDELLDEPAQPDASVAFLLDGQAVVLEDYLEVRPERAADLSAALREKRLEAGPWYVLADELIPSGEGLVRNLLAGRRVLRSLRAEAPPVLYCPDSFGHPAALPSLARGFGKSLVLLWRGFGGSSHPTANAFSWVAPDGDRVVAWHLTRSGYELGANLPREGAAARDRWKRVRAELAERANVPVTLLLNGADHHARQRHLGSALRALRESAAPDVVESSTLARFAGQVEDAAARAALPDVRGEMRDSYGFTWTLQGTLASRTMQKRRYVRRERELLRDVEPWAALAVHLGRGSRRHLVDAAWKPLLLCQPHDTLCGCSVDQVARAMETRLESVATQAAGLREDALFALLEHDTDLARSHRDAWRPSLVVRNRAARARRGVAIVELTAFVADVGVGPGSSHVELEDLPRPQIPTPAGAGPVQVLEQWLELERVEAPRAYPDNDAVAGALAAVWIEEVPALGLAVLPFGGALTRPLPVPPVRVSDGMMANQHIILRFSADGTVMLEQGGRKIPDFVGWESRADVGDLYTPAIRDEKLQPQLIATRVVHRGPLCGMVEQRWTLRDGDARIDATMRFILDADARWVRIQLSGKNGARDHRLRVVINTDVVDGTIVADAAFGPVERGDAPEPVAGAALVEEPVPSAPLHRYVSCFDRQRGATIYADGLTEYEFDEGSMFATVLRSVGELSRSDLPERPGHAGWPARTPEAQGIGRFQAEIAVTLHGARSAAVTSEIERMADDILFPLTGETQRSLLRVPDPVRGPELRGDGLALSAVKESEDGEWLVLRCVNLLEQESAGSWRLPRAIREARLARLDETPLSPLESQGEEIRFLAPPRGIVTILAR